MSESDERIARLVERAALLMLLAASPAARHAALLAASKTPDDVRAAAALVERLSRRMDALGVQLPVDRKPRRRRSAVAPGVALQKPHRGRPTQG